MNTFFSALAIILAVWAVSFMMWYGIMLPLGMTTTFGGDYIPFFFLTLLIAGISTSFTKK